MREAQGRFIYFLDFFENFEGNPEGMRLSLQDQYGKDALAFNEFDQLVDGDTANIRQWEVNAETIMYALWANDSTYWLVFELIWRDYFRFVAMKYGSRIFHRKALKPDSANRGTQRPAFEAWKEGRTKDAFVNANMKELARTGFMSNRGRQNVASYLVHDLGIDWRMGASWFEHMLLDYDPASNAGNWIYVAGVGNDPRPNRKFNTQRQAEMYDGDGKYQTLWSTDALELDVR